MASLTLGELLKKKAEDGVVVLIMIWGETTSIMGTHDTETENFFKGEISFYISKIFQNFSNKFRALLQKQPIQFPPRNRKYMYCISFYERSSEYIFKI